jgi:hypothetical protein
MEVSWFIRGCDSLLIGGVSLLVVWMRNVGRTLGLGRDGFG